jgi:hypothetical protein
VKSSTAHTVNSSIHQPILTSQYIVIAYVLKYALHFGMSDDQYISDDEQDGVSRFPGGDFLKMETSTAVVRSDSVWTQELSELGMSVSGVVETSTMLPFIESDLSNISVNVLSANLPECTLVSSCSDHLLASGIAVSDLEQHSSALSIGTVVSDSLQSNVNQIDSFESATVVSGVSILNPSHRSVFDHSIDGITGNILVSDFADPESVFSLTGNGITATGNGLAAVSDSLYSTIFGGIRDWEEPSWMSTDYSRILPRNYDRNVDLSDLKYRWSKFRLSLEPLFVLASFSARIDIWFETWFFLNRLITVSWLLIVLKIRVLICSGCILSISSDTTSLTWGCRLAVGNSSRVSFLS